MQTELVTGAVVIRIGEAARAETGFGGVGPGGVFDIAVDIKHKGFAVDHSPGVFVLWIILLVLVVKPDTA